MAKKHTRASEDHLGELHEALAKSYKLVLEKVIAGDVDLDPRVLKEVREFLRDNKITCEVSAGDPLEFLRDELPFMEDEVRGHLQ